MFVITDIIFINITCLLSLYYTILITNTTCLLLRRADVLAVAERQAGDLGGVAGLGNSIYIYIS